METFLKSYGIVIGLAILSEVLFVMDLNFWGIICCLVGLLALINALKSPFVKFIIYMDKETD